MGGLSGKQPLVKAVEEKRGGVHALVPFEGRCYAVVEM